MQGTKLTVLLNRAIGIKKKAVDREHNGRKEAVYFEKHLFESRDV